MIVFNIECKECGFGFEGWFGSSKEFEKQKKSNLISCPNCNSFKISKALVAPNVAKKSNSKNNKKLKPLANNLSKMKKIVENHFDYVGEDFTEEAKKIKYGEVKERAIYGEASIEQTKELIDEDIDVLPLPFSTKKTN